MPYRAIRLQRFLFAIAVLLAILYIVIGIPLRQAREAWREGKTLDALATLQKWSRLRLRPADYAHALAVVHLSRGQRREAAPYLQKIARRTPDFFPILEKEEVALSLVRAALYEEFLLYDSAVKGRRESDAIALCRSAALLGTGRIDQAAAAFARVDEDDVDPKQYAALRQSLQERKRGSFPWLVDRDGKTLAAYHIDNRDVVTMNGDFASLIEAEAGSLTFESNLAKLGTASTIETTLDPHVQKAAVFALGGLRGAIVAIDTRTNELLAVASSTRSTPANLAFDTQYEPGSVVKVLTALAALDGGIPMERFFPLDCEGFLVLNNRQFFDWAKHDRLADLNDAMAVSCNVAFGKLGTALRGERLATVMAAAGFDSEADLGAFRVPLGKTKIQIHDDDYSIATYAVGLEHLSINALHLAMIGAAVANQGTITSPRLIRGRRSLLGDSLAFSTRSSSRAIASPAATMKVIESMKAVVTNPRGTGRRVAVTGLTIAMKTGTAGQSVPGYDALIVGFAPADAPRIAVGMILEHAGPAEFAGAKATSDFFARIRDRL